MSPTPVVDLDDAPASRTDEPDPAASPPERAHRWTLPAVMIVAVVPIWVAALRAGVHRLHPYSDGAATVLRALQVFDGPFPLAGMKAAGASQTGFDVYFPAAWQLYLLAGPTRVFGVVWGPLVTMAFTNTVWVVLAIWLLHRRLPRPQALLGAALLCVLLWSLGSGYAISPVPMQMVIIPTVLFFVAVWAVADGDRIAIPILALVANYLWLDHLVLVLTIPIVGLVAPLGLWWGWVRARRHRPDPAPAPGRRPGPHGRLGTNLLAAGAITVLMWIPPLIQQLTTSPGNLRVLIANVGADRPAIDSWSRAWYFTTAVITRPWFWFRGTVENPPYEHAYADGTMSLDPTGYDTVAGVVLVLALVALGVAAHRRRDRTGLLALIVAAMGIVAGVATTQAAPTYIGVPTGYLGSLWVGAMFVWFAILLNIVRAVPALPARAVTAVAGAAVVVFSVANLPTANYGYGTDRAADSRVDRLIDRVVPELRGDGPVQIIAAGFDNFHYAEALTLALVDDGTPFCVAERAYQSDGARPRCPDHGFTLVSVSVEPWGTETVDPTGTVLFQESFVPAAQRDRLSALDQRVDTWLANRDALVLSDPARAVFDDLDEPDMQATIDRWHARHRNDDDAIARTWTEFTSLIRLWHGSAFAAVGPLFTDPPLDSDEWLEWLALARDAQTLTVTRR